MSDAASGGGGAGQTPASDDSIPAFCAGCGWEGHRGELIDHLVSEHRDVLISNSAALFAVPPADEETVSVGLGAGADDSDYTYWDLRGRFHERFAANVLNKAGDILAHFDFRADTEEQIVMNNYVRPDGWFSEERVSTALAGVRPGKLFAIRITMKPAGYELRNMLTTDEGTVLYTFAHRVDPSQAVDMLLSGSTGFIQAQTHHGAGSTLVRPSGDRRMWVMRGHMFTDGEPTVNFVDGHGNTLFHFNPRNSEQCVVMNSNLGGSWSSEQRIPFHKLNWTTDGPISVAIVATQEGFEIRTCDTDASTASLPPESWPLIDVFKHRLPWPRAFDHIERHGYLATCTHEVAVGAKGAT